MTAKELAQQLLISTLHRSSSLSKVVAIDHAVVCSIAAKVVEQRFSGEKCEHKNITNSNGVHLCLDCGQKH